MKLIGKSGCIVTGVALVGITHLLQSSQWCQVFVSGWAYSLPPELTWPCLLSLTWFPHIAISCCSWSWLQMSAWHPTQLAASCIYIWNELRVWLLWNLWLYLSLRVARICTEKRRARERERILTQDRGTPHIEANALSFMMERLVRNPHPHNMTLHIADCMGLGTERHQNIERKTDCLIVSFVFISGYH